jgi:hypothetical protein
VVVTVANTQAAGLVAAYSFNETTGTTVNDASGNNNAGTLGTGVTRTTSGRFGGALTFANGYVTVPHAASLNLTTGMTLEAWLFPTTVANWATAVMKEQPGEFVYSLYAAAPQTPGGYFNVGSSGSTERQVNAPASLAVNNWTHVAATFDGSTSRLYINGSEVANHDFSGPIATSTGALRIGGNAVWGEFFSGRIDEVRIYNRALSPAEILADMSTPVGSAGEDTTPPVVAVVSPAAGATVSGNVVLSATASDNFGVAGVKFLIDGVPQSVESVMPPYTANWDASAVAPGLHTVEALARDFAGNTSRSGVVSVNVLPSQASTLGQWSAPFNWPLIPITSVLLKTGEVMGWEYDGAGGPYLWNPLTNQFTPIHNTSNLFCGGQVALPDGRIFIAGGHVASHVGLAETNIFDPVARTWSVGPNMAVGRWYPTVTTLADGRALITEGETTCDGCNALIPEVYNPLTNQLTRLTSASLNIPYYPHMYLLPDGRLFAAGTAEAPIASRVLDLATQSWSVVDPTVVDGGSSVMYLPGKIMKSGTSHNPDLPADPSSANTYVIDMTSASPHWVQTAPMAFPRTYHNLTVLPDGDVLVTGGGRTSDAVDQAGGVLAAELWSPATQTYTTLASGQIARLYHSTALLLPDGRVLVTGGGRFNGFPSNDPSDHVEAEIFSPPYLYKGPRPTITSAPSDATYGSHITVQTPDTPDIASVSLIKLGAVTHAFNMEQRFIPLNFTAGSQQLDVEMPANGNLAPPGHYMLFIVNGNGVPSVATIVQIH